MNKYSKYDILDGLTSIRVGLLSILGEMPTLKEYTLDIPHLNINIFMSILQYAKDKDIVKKLLFFRHNKTSITVIYYASKINIKVTDKNVVFTFEG